MILSDRSIREQIAAGRIIVEPFDDSLVQPSSIDVRLDRHFRVFRNHTAGVIDVKRDMSSLTEPVEVGDDRPFMLHPGEFVLASTVERVALPDDVVARIEGKSSLARLGLLIHSSLPASEPLLVLDDRGLSLRTIGEIVKEPRHGRVVAFDPVTFEVGYHEITGHYEGPADRIYEVRLASGRSVRVTAGHNLFSLDEDGELIKLRTGDLRPGQHIAIARRIPEPEAPTTALRVLDAIPESERRRFTVRGPSVARRCDDDAALIASLLLDAGVSVGHHQRRACLPLPVVAHLDGLGGSLTAEDRIGVRGGRNTVPAVIAVDEEMAWLLGMYVAEGYRRSNQVTISHTDQALLDRLVAALARLGLSVHRAAGAITCCSAVLSELVGWLGTGGHAPTKRIPPAAFGWPDDLLAALVQGIIDGDGSVDATRTSVWTTSPGLVADLLLAFARLGRRAGSCCRLRGHRPIWQVDAPHLEHELLVTAPLPDQLLRSARAETGLTQRAAAASAGDRHATDLNNLERRSAGRDAVNVATLRRLRGAYRTQGATDVTVGRLDRLIDGGVAWDRVVEVVDTGSIEPIYDLEVRPGGRKIENFLAGSGGVFVSNTAGFVDAGFDGHITLELANVASLPITLYPGMKIGQISFMEMTTPADAPYGKGARGSKYQGQRGPTPSRYFENFS